MSHIGYYPEYWGFSNIPIPPRKKSAVHVTYDLSNQTTEFNNQRTFFVIHVQTHFQYSIDSHDDRGVMKGAIAADEKLGDSAVLVAECGAHSLVNPCS